MTNKNGDLIHNKRPRWYSGYEESLILDGNYNLLNKTRVETTTVLSFNPEGAT
jgi:hypothetical protein